jgi:hypothetical protein
MRKIDRACEIRRQDLVSASYVGSSRVGHPKNVKASSEFNGWATRRLRDQV